MFVMLALATMVLTPSPTDPEPAWQAPVSGEVEVVRPFQAPASAWGPGHRGADLAAEPGSRVVAAGAGRVSFAGRVAGRGIVVIAHPGGLRTTYEPVRADVEAGAVTALGEPIGRLQIGGHCAPQQARPCLHWGLRRGETYADPMALLARRADATAVVLLPLDPVAGPADPATVVAVPGPVSSGSGSPAVPSPERGPGAVAMTTTAAGTTALATALGLSLARRRGGSEA